MQITKHTIIAPALSGIAEFIWHLTSDENITGGKLLPVVNTDLIINLSPPIFYTSVEGERIQAPPIHIRNVKLQPQSIDQEAICNVWGVSLFPHGVYSLLGRNLKRYSEYVVDLRQINPRICDALLESLCGNQGESDAAERIEEAIVQHLEALLPDSDRKAIDHFLSEMRYFGIGEYCQANGIGIKKLERLIKKYTGLTPKQLQRIARFQKAGNEMLYNDKSPSIADIAYSYKYADQMHLTKTFQEYSGVTPFLFLKTHDSIKEKLHRKD